MPLEDVIGREPVQPEPSAPSDPVWIQVEGPYELRWRLD